MWFGVTLMVRSLKSTVAVAATVPAVLLAACGAGENRAADGGTELPAVFAATSGSPLAASAGTVDSIFPMEVMIERFQAEAGRRPATLRGAARSRDELVAAFVAAVESSSMAALRGLRMDVAEYAHLYVPTSHLSRDPYRQPPAIGWLLTEQNGLKGEARLLRRFGGRPLGFRSYDCPEAPVVEGDNTLWRNCVVDLGASGQPVRLFGTIIERAGRYKFISLANDL